MSDLPRVFVSSVMAGFEEYRQAAREAIGKAHFEPVLIEDNPSLDATSRNACLDGVESCDVVVVVIGERGGWEAESGKLVVEEEFDHARAKSIPTLLFLQEGVERDAPGQSLARKLSDYIDGRFRRTFATPQGLVDEIQASLKLIAPSGGGLGMNTERMQSILGEPCKFGHDPVLRVVVAPSRQGETVIAVEDLDDKDFRYELVRMGTDREIALFDPNVQRRFDRLRDAVVVEEGDARSGDTANALRLQLSEDGWLTVDLSLRDQGSRSSWEPLAGMLPLAVEDLSDRAACVLRFAHHLYGLIDPYERHVGLFVNASLGSLNGRGVTSRGEVEKLKSASRMTMSMGFGESGLPIAFTHAERASRTDAEWVSTLAGKIASRLERFVNTQDSSSRF